jgi:AcrR family transcriptional regulator
MTPPKPSSSGVEGAKEGRPLRADARRNRARIREAAEAVFAAEGASASTEQVARRAGVGVGTVFRHFPTKETLVEEIVLARVGRLVEEADALAAKGDPTTALLAFFKRTMEEAEAKKTYAEVLAGGFVEVESVAPELHRRLQQRIEELLERAQEAGIVRYDVGVPEVMALLVGAVRAAEHAGRNRELRERTMTVFLDGLRGIRGR